MAINTVDDIGLNGPFKKLLKKVGSAVSNTFADLDKLVSNAGGLEQFDPKKEFPEWLMVNFKITPSQHDSLSTANQTLIQQEWANYSYDRIKNITKANARKSNKIVASIIAAAVGAEIASGATSKVGDFVGDSDLGNNLSNLYNSGSDLFKTGSDFFGQFNIGGGQTESPSPGYNPNLLPTPYGQNTQKAGIGSGLLIVGTLLVGGLIYFQPPKTAKKKQLDGLQPIVV